jgi:rubrerythrin
VGYVQLLASNPALKYVVVCYQCGYIATAGEDSETGDPCPYCGDVLELTTEDDVDL